MKIATLIIYFALFFYYVILGGVDDFIRAETSFINSEIKSYKKENQFKKHEYVTPEFVTSLRENYRKTHNKQSTTFNNQLSKFKVFSLVTIFTSFILIFLLKANYWYILSLLIPFVYVASRLYLGFGILQLEYLIYPVLAILVTATIKFTYNKWNRIA